MRSAIVQGDNGAFVPNIWNLSLVNLESHRHSLMIESSGYVCDKLVNNGGWGNRGIAALICCLFLFFEEGIYGF